MKNLCSLDVLIIEDSEYSADLNIRELKRGGFDVKAERTDNEEGMERALSEKKWDVILSDNSMPMFDAIHALGVRNKLAPGTPFLIVSEHINRDDVEYALNNGCRSFLHKRDLNTLADTVREIMSR